MKYGEFSKEGKEFIIQRQDTPSPWINYLYNGRYFATISNNGGGISYFRSPLHGRITRYRINDVPPDRPGKYLYLKDRDTGEIWSLTWQPVGKNRDAYRVAHGFGYTRAEAVNEQIHSEVLFFVPPDDDLEVWQIRLKNSSDKVRRLSIYGYVEFALGHALIDLINQCDDQHFNRVVFDRYHQTLWATKTYWVTETGGTQQQENKAWDRWAFFTVNQPVSGFETLRERFMGLYRNENNPVALEQNTLGSKETDYGNTVGALQVDFELVPRETKEIIFSLGVIPKEDRNSAKGLKQATKYHDTDQVTRAFRQLNDQWSAFFAYASVETPDPESNLFMNYWTPYQAKVAFDVGRVTSFYYWGIGRGFGFRDTAQDIIAITLSDPGKAAERIRLLARQMQQDGKVYHHFFGDGEGEFTRHCDDALWFILAVDEYLRETGDQSFLQVKEPYLDGGQGSLLDHLMAVVRYAGNNIGRHGLPVFGRGDWNDTLDYIGGDEGGESVWGGMFYVAMLNRLIDILEWTGLQTTHVLQIRDRLVEAIDDYCWDGSWYLRAFGAQNRPVGSHNNEFGKIFMNTQTWPVIANLPDKKRINQAMDSVKKFLDTEEGPKICAPAYREIDPGIGLITRCVRGKKENGAVFNHPTAWLIQAACLLGRGDEAYSYYKKLLPARKDQQRYHAEPYVYSQYITSDEHDHPGKASHSWQTGTAAWMYRVVYDYMLGIRPYYNGLQINPVIPSHWKGFKAIRVFRGTRYEITVSNPDGVQSGIKEIKMDGKKIQGLTIPVTRNNTCQINVLMGANQHPTSNI